MQVKKAWEAAVWERGTIYKMVLKKNATGAKHVWIGSRTSRERRDPKYVLANVVPTEIGERLWVDSFESAEGFKLSSLEDEDIIYMFGTQQECEKLMMQLIALKEEV